MQIVQGFTPQSRSLRCDLCGQGPGKTVPSDSDSPDRNVLDLDLYIDLEGAVQICLSCAEYAGTLVGLISEVKADELEAKVTDLTSRLSVSEDSRTSAEDALIALLRTSVVTAPEPIKVEPTAKKAPAAKKAQARG